MYNRRINNVMNDLNTVVKMEERLKQLSQLHCYVEGVDKEVTMMLQNLQWDRKLLLQMPPTAVCSYDKHHKLPQGNLKTHEVQCILKSQGYLEEDLLLPEPLDINSNTLVKLNTQEILKIINDASIQDQLIKKGKEVHRFMEPLTFERLQCTYTTDERRAIHDAVVGTVPACHNLSDLALPSPDCKKGDKEKSRAEILAELRNMKRRRPKYRVAAKTRNYSDVLRDVIKTQMEFFSGAIQTKNTGNVNTKTPHYLEKNMKIQRKNIDCGTFVSKNVRIFESSKRNQENDRIGREYNESHYGERERSYEHTKRTESSARKCKERRDNYHKSNSYRGNREIESHDLDNSKRDDQKEREVKRNISREPYTNDKSANVETPERGFRYKETYSNHHNGTRNEDHNRECEKSRKRDEAKRREGKNVDKERLDITTHAYKSKSCRRNYYNSFNSYSRSRKDHYPIKVEKKSLH